MTDIDHCPNTGTLLRAWSRERGGYMLCRDCLRWVRTPVLIAECVSHQRDGRYVLGVCGSPVGILGSASEAAEHDGDFDLTGMDVMPWDAARGAAP